MQSSKSSNRHTLIGGLILAVWAVWTLSQYWDHWPPDLSALYMAARFYGLEQFSEVYASPARFFGTDFPVTWTDELTRLGYGGEQTFPYIYPPLWAALLSPMAVRVDPVNFFNAVYAVHITMLAIMPVLAWRLMRPNVGFAWFAALSVILLGTSLFTNHALLHSQPQITVSFLVLFSFERLAGGRRTSAGLLLGLAAGLKLSPIALLLIFLAQKEWRAALIALATAAGLALLSLAIAGPALHHIFLEKVSLLGDQLMVWNLNISMRTALFQLSEAISGRTWPAGSTAHPLLVESPGWIGPVVTGIFAVLFMLVLYLTQHAPNPTRLAHRLGAGMILLTLCGPLGWAHHYLVPLVLLPGLAGPLSRLPWLALMLAVGLIFSIAGVAALGFLSGSLNLTTPLMVAGLLGLAAVFTLTTPRQAR